VLDGLDLRIEPGQRVLLTGPSGSGKSTLLRALAGLLLTADSGDLSGTVRVDGREPQAVPGQVALLLQDPTAALVAERVGRDVAFGPENLGLERREIWRRVHAALHAVGFPYDVDHATAALSGGEAQRLALAGALALEPRVVLLDEPTSMLDPEAAADVRRSALDVVADRGSTMVVVEHRIEPWLDHVDRLLVLDRSGAPLADGDPRALLREQGHRLARGGVWVPGHDLPAPAPLPAELVAPWEPECAAGPLVCAREVSVRHRRRYGARGPTRTTLALDRVSAELAPGRALAVTGPSGAGKSTLVSVLAGLRRPDGGTVQVADRLAVRRSRRDDGDGRNAGDSREPSRWPSVPLARRLSWVPQTPEHGVVASTVAGEVLAAARAVGREPGRARRRATGLLEALGLAGMAERDPHHLSGGEQRRLMLAAALAHGPYALLLDEPTVGQDRGTWAAVLGCCRAARAAGTAVGTATHDESLVRALADTRVHLRQGRVVGA
jgi:energy-coupling factor transport system permease/ATP-binding protein